MAQIYVHGDVHVMTLQVTLEVSCSVVGIFGMYFGFPSVINKQTQCIIIKQIK